MFICFNTLHVPGDEDWLPSSPGDIVPSSVGKLGIGGGGSKSLGDPVIGGGGGATTGCIEYEGGGPIGGIGGGGGDPIGGIGGGGGDPIGALLTSCWLLGIFGISGGGGGALGGAWFRVRTLRLPVVTALGATTGVGVVGVDDVELWLRIDGVRLFSLTFVLRPCPKEKEKYENFLWLPLREQKHTSIYKFIHKQ